MRDLLVDRVLLLLGDLDDARQRRLGLLERAVALLELEDLVLDRRLLLLREVVGIERCVVFGERDEDVDDLLLLLKLLALLKGADLLLRFGLLRLGSLELLRVPVVLLFSKASAEEEGVVRTPESTRTV